MKKCSLDVDYMFNAATGKHKRQNQFDGHSICDRCTDAQCLKMLSLNLFKAPNIDSSTKCSVALLSHGPSCVNDFYLTRKCWVKRRYCLAGTTKLGERVAGITKLE
jgi:hypothetical protein